MAQLPSTHGRPRLVPALRPTKPTYIRTWDHPGEEPVLTHLHPSSLNIEDARTGDTSIIGRTRKRSKIKSSLFCQPNQR